MLLKVQEYAARERISKVAAYKRLKRCGIKPVNELIDAEHVARVWDSIKDDAQTRERPAKKAKEHRAEPKPAASSTTSFNETRAKRELVRLEREALDLAKIRNRLVPIDQVEAAVFERAHTEREELLNWPARVCPTLAAELGVDDRKLFNLLEREVRAFLQDRSNGPLFDDNADDNRFRRKSA